MAYPPTVIILFNLIVLEIAEIFSHVKRIRILQNTDHGNKQKLETSVFFFLVLYVFNVCLRCRNKCYSIPTPKSQFLYPTLHKPKTTIEFHNKQVRTSSDYLFVANTLLSQFIGTDPHK